MPRARSPERDLAYQLWLDSGKQKKLKDIAEELGVPEGKVRKWKSLDNWEGNVPKQRKGNVPKREVKKIAKRVTENQELTDQQRLFCIYFSKTFNATSAYQKAYGCSYAAAMSSGSELLRNPKVKAEIQRLKQARYTQALLSPEDIFQRYMDIAFADMSDLLSWGREAVPVMGPFGPVTETDPETGEKVPVLREVNVVKLKESDAVDTTLVGEVKQGRDGVTVKLPDRMKALDWLASHMDMATPEQKAKTDKLIAETERLKAGGAGSQDNEFLNAWKQSIIDGYKDNKDGEE
jgi:phage terminase small subunit